jgi:hypothetical protein
MVSPYWNTFLTGLGKKDIWAANIYGTLARSYKIESENINNYNMQGKQSKTWFMLQFMLWMSAHKACLIITK